MHSNIYKVFFCYSALKMTKCQLLKISFYGRNKKKRLRKKKVLVPELFLPYSYNSSDNLIFFSENLLRVDT